jgi:hypothetical protein
MMTRASIEPYLKYLVSYNCNEKYHYHKTIDKRKKRQLIYDDNPQRTRAPMCEDGHFRRKSTRKKMCLL